MTDFAQRGAMQPIARRVRAYFAPVNRATSAPTVFDPAKDGRFALDAPPAGWFDAGWIEGFTRTATTNVESLRAGARGEVRAQARSKLGATLEFRFREWGKLQMALSTGSQQMNLLAEMVGATPNPSGGNAGDLSICLTGTTATQLMLSTGAVASFQVGDLVAVDVNYGGETGYVGTGIAGAFVKAPEDVAWDASYIRRVTYNVGRVVARGAGDLQLAQPLLGGVPLAGAAVQKVVGFVDREGGSFFQEWSALFALESETGARVYFHYPRVRTRSGGEESQSRVADAFDAWSLHAKLIALPSVDTNDGESVVCYRSYIPEGHSAVY